MAIGLGMKAYKEGYKLWLLFIVNQSIKKASLKELYEFFKNRNLLMERDSCRERNSTS
ncbi:hypothetical protein [Bacillus cihuensis]|uniref:hypothetical protein n=1 Tax=Bacillus cihuensis TaxID=1208599 RepID=UPI001F39582D|nr:hypothetical protein [Bacillus cihuensis]